MLIMMILDLRFPAWSGGVKIHQFMDLYTPLKINIEPKHEGLEDEFPLETGDFQVLC